jgi:hypothetical protein
MLEIFKETEAELKELLLLKSGQDIKILKQAE